MIIKILGTGCSNCKRLEENAKKAVEDLGVEATIEKVTDIKEIMKYGVMKTPAIVVDEKVKAFGRVPKVEEIKKYL
jgi:small redox-active disulfide protein 2